MKHLRLKSYHLGRYKAAEVNGQQRTDGARWHQGIITGRSKSSTGQIIFSGNHTKGSEDGKWCTYKDYRNSVTKGTFTGCYRLLGVQYAAYFAASEYQ